MDGGEGGGVCVCVFVRVCVCWSQPQPRQPLEGMAAVSGRQTDNPAHPTPAPPPQQQENIMLLRSMWTASCIFRLDGILVDSLDVHARVWERVAQAIDGQWVAACLPLPACL